LQRGIDNLDLSPLKPDGFQEARRRLAAVHLHQTISQQAVMQDHQ
jgi:hypothetical protein